MFSASRTGSVAYHSGAGQRDSWCGSTGTATRSGRLAALPAIRASSARLSPDDSALLAARQRAGLGTSDIWRMDFDPRPTNSSSLRTAATRWTPVWIDAWACHRLCRRQPGVLAALVPKRPCHRVGRTDHLAARRSTRRSMDVFPDGRVVPMLERTSGGTRDYSSCLWLVAHLRRRCCQGQLSIFHMRLSPDGSAMTFVAGLPQVA